MSPDSATLARRALGVLLLVYTFNFIDRIILGILVPPINAELHLSDTELGLLGGTAFALFYTALGIPIGWLADRVNRVWIITAALALWSAFAAACGSIHSFSQLFLMRLGVGVGEAGGVAPAYSLLSDYYPPERRARAMAIYSFGIPIGSAAGLLFGGLIAARVNWRMAFYVVGLAGLVLVPFVPLLAREPRRASPARRAGLGAVLTVLLAKPSFWLLSLGGATCSIMGYGLFFWLPSFFSRSYHLKLAQVSWLLASLTLVGGLAGIWAGGLIADRLGSARRSAYALVPAVALLVTAPCYALGTFAPPAPWVLPLYLVPTGLALVWLGPTICAVQHLVPAQMRTVAAAAFLFVNNLIGLGLGSLLLGRMSDYYKAEFGQDSLRHAIRTGTGFYVLSAVLFVLAARRLASEWHTDRAPDEAAS